MKKVICLLMSLCLLCMAVPALAADQPFQDNVYYGEKYTDFGAAPSMLNFGSTKKLSPGESLFDAKTTTLKKISASSLVSGLADNTYYIYAKWQYGQGFSSHTINAMLVMTTPGGLYYAMYQSWDLEDIHRRTICRWFFDVSDMLQRCMDENNGTFEKGDYSFSMFFNDQSFKVAKLKVN